MGLGIARPFLALAVGVSGLGACATLPRVDTAAGWVRSPEELAIAEAARRDARAAADRAEVTSRAALGVLGGLPLGFFGYIAAIDRDRLAVGLTAAGLGLVAVAAGGRPEAPVVLPHATRADSVYARAYEDEYVWRLTHRRRSAALSGGAAGAAVGLGVLFWLLSQITT